MCVNGWEASTILITFRICPHCPGREVCMHARVAAHGIYSLIFGLISLINPSAFGNVNSPHNGLINRSVLLSDPIAWYIITVAVALMCVDRAKSQV